ncbi:MAG: type II toxin-antitoxin system VapC family toxin [Puniceicoccaceae bacterium]
MTHYFDTGVILKLYTNDPEFHAVQKFVVSTSHPIPFVALHHSECSSALHLKVFRGECSVAQANRALANIEEDLRSGVLHPLQPDWEKVWHRCAELARSHAAFVGCRTLDSLHVACSLAFGFREFVTSDARQSNLAERAGLSVRRPS